MDMYFVMLHATPQRTNPESVTCGGAYISYWVRARDVDEAIARAHTRISEEGWEADEVHQVVQTRRENYDSEENAEELECFDEAVEYGEAITLYTYPIKDEQ